VDAGKENVWALVKDTLRAVAVVVVHIQHRNARQAGIAQVLGRQGCVVEKAVAAKIIGAGMVAGRPA
jgi:hypothetical protein